MRKFSPLPLLLAGAVSVSFHVDAQDVYKCVGVGSTAYQSMPCDNGQEQTRFARVAHPTQPAAPTPTVTRSGAVASVSVPRSAVAATVGKEATKAWPGRRTIAIGMSDDEVLNLPGWGIPNRIARAKSSKGWREEWTYLGSTWQERQ